MTSIKKPLDILKKEGISLYSRATFQVANDSESRSTKETPNRIAALVPRVKRLCENKDK